MTRVLWTSASSRIRCSAFGLLLLASHSFSHACHGNASIILCHMFRCCHCFRFRLAMLCTMPPARQFFVICARASKSSIFPRRPDLLRPAYARSSRLFFASSPLLHTHIYTYNIHTYIHTYIMLVQYTISYTHIHRYTVCTHTHMHIRIHHTYTFSGDREGWRGC